MAHAHQTDLQHLIEERFGEDAASPDLPPIVQTMAARGSCRSFQDQPVPDALLRSLAAIALASPTKSDLQQRDLVFLKSQDAREHLSQLVPGQAWVAHAPMIVIFCGNNRRQRLLHDWRGVPFANDHLDAFFNASVDAAIALGAFVTAAEACGLGCCPISAVRNEAQAVSDLLALPDHVFPIAGLALGYPAATPPLSKRLPLNVTVHTDQYREENLRQEIDTYDQAREAAQPYAQQRFPESFGTAPDYGWSEDKIRQYSREERQDFGAFIRSKGFRLE